MPYQTNKIPLNSAIDHFIFLFCRILFYLFVQCILSILIFQEIILRNLVVNRQYLRERNLKK